MVVKIVASTTILQHRAAAQEKSWATITQSDKRSLRTKKEIR